MNPEQQKLSAFVGEYLLIIIISVKESGFVGPLEFNVARKKRDKGI